MKLHEITSFDEPEEKKSSQERLKALYGLTKYYAGKLNVLFKKGILLLPYHADDNSDFKIKQEYISERGDTVYIEWYISSKVNDDVKIHVTALIKKYATALTRKNRLEFEIVH